MSYFTRIFFPVFVFLVFPLISSGQIDKGYSGNDRPVRIEIPAKSTDETYKIIPCSRTGVVMFFKSIEAIGDSMSKWYFSLYDKNLHQSWVKSIPIKNGMIFRESSFSNDTLAMLFVKTGKEKGSRYNFIILRIALKSVSFIGNTGTIPEETEEIEFKVFKGLGFLCYNVKDDTPRLQLLQLANGNSTTFYWSKISDSRILGFSVDSLTLRIRASLAEVASGKSRMENFLVSMDITGKILAKIPIQSAAQNRFLRGLDFIPVDAESWLVFGSYGTIPPKSSGKNKKIIESSGFFSCKLTSTQLYDLNFVNLLELNNSKDLIGDKDVMALKKKALKKNRNLYEYSLDYPLLLHKVFMHNDQFVLLAESFLPQYHSESFTEFDFYGRPYVNTYQVFDGYRYNNGIITAYDKNGKLAWDNTIEIRNLVTFDLTPKVTVFFTPDDEAVLTYLSEGKIASKIIKENSVVEKLDFSALEMSNSEDKMLSESKSGMAPWYDKYFLCYGYQEIKNINAGGNNKRLVFYFTKIAFE